MRVSIIVDDNAVIIGGKMHIVDCSAFLTIHAVQWFGQNGEVEFKPTFEGRPPNQSITDISQFQPLIDAWQFIEDNPPPPPLPTADELRAQQFAADSVRQVMVDQLRTATPDQIKTFIQNNVTDLASARVMLTRLALAIALIVRR